MCICNVLKFGYDWGISFFFIKLESQSLRVKHEKPCSFFVLSAIKNLNGGIEIFCLHE
jgi:hypothetical protein